MIIPPFNRISDPFAAAAFSESFEPGACKSVLGSSYPTEPGENPGFPPEPTELLCVTGTYLHPRRGLVENYATVGTSPASKRQILNLYSDTVVSRQKTMQDLLEVTKHMPGLQTEEELRQKYLDMVGNTRRQLVAAHIIGRVASTNKLADALVLPTAVSEGLPMEVRHFIAPLVAKLSPDHPLKESLKPLLSMDAEGREVASIVSVSFLPSIRTMRRAL